jgi:hypothetical protein
MMNWYEFNDNIVGIILKHLSTFEKGRTDEKGRLVQRYKGNNVGRKYIQLLIQMRVPLPSGGYCTCVRHNCKKIFSVPTGLYHPTYQQSEPVCLDFCMLLLNKIPRSQRFELTTCNIYNPEINKFESITLQYWSICDLCKLYKEKGMSDQFDCYIKDFTPGEECCDFYRHEFWKQEQENRMKSKLLQSDQLLS